MDAASTVFFPIQKIFKSLIPRNWVRAAATPCKFASFKRHAKRQGGTDFRGFPVVRRFRGTIQSATRSMASKLVSLAVPRKFRSVISVDRAMRRKKRRGAACFRGGVGRQAFGKEVAL
jgi:hypothetical protein